MIFEVAVKRVLLSIVLLSSLLASATPTYVRSNATWGNTMTTCQVALSTTNSSDLIAVWTSWTTSVANTVTVTTVQDTQGNGTGTPAVYPSAVGPTIQSASNTAGQIFYAANIHGGSVDTVTVSFSGTTSSSNCVIVEYSGADLSNPLDSASAGYSNSAAELLDSGTVAPANSNLLVFGAGIIDANTTYGLIAGGGFTSRQAAHGASGSGIVEDNAVSGNTALQRATSCLETTLGTCPGTTPGDWLMQMAVFRDASWTVTAGWSPSRFANILDATQFPGVDIGAQIQNAYNALPATGGHMIVPATPDGTCRNFSTQISFQTKAKYALLECGSASGSLGTSAVQGCLNYQPLSGTALLLDYAVGAVGPGSGSALASAHGVRNCTLINNQCQTAGGCTVPPDTAIGIDFGDGTVNKGAQSGTMENVSVIGFATGVQNINFYSDPMTWINPQIWDNGVGMMFGDVSTTAIFGGFVNGNVQGIQAYDKCSRSELHFHSTSFVGNSLAFNYLLVGGSGSCPNGAANAGPPAFLFLDDVHLENGQTHTAPPNYIEGNVDVYISGGVAENDSSMSCTTYNNWFFLPSGNKFIVDGMTFNAGTCGSPANGIVDAANNTRISVSGFNSGASSLTIVGGANAASATERMSNGNITNTPSTWVYESPIAASALSSFSTVTASGAGNFHGDVAGFRFEDSNGTPLVAATDFAFSGGWGSTTTFMTSSLKGSDGAWSGVVKSTGTGQAANPTITLTFHDGMWSAIPVCSTKINATTDSPSQLTVAVTDNPTTTTDVIEFWGTPILNDTYTFSSTCTGKAD